MTFFRQKLLVFAVFLVFPPFYSYATEPCQFLSETAFRARVLAPADTIVVATVENYSTIQESIGIRWTLLKVMKSYRGDARGDITVTGWQATQPPLFTYGKGSQLFLFLKRSRGGYELTDDHWDECVPSVMAIQNDAVFPSFNVDEISMNQKWIAADRLTSYLLRK